MITPMDADRWAVTLGGIGVVIWDAADHERPEMVRMASLRAAVIGLKGVLVSIEAAIRIAECEGWES